MGRLELTNRAGISASNTNQIADTSDAGTIQILAGNIKIEKGSEISSNTFRTGSSGKIDITANSIVIEHSHARLR